MCAESSLAATLTTQQGTAAGAGTRLPMPLSGLSPMVRVKMFLIYGGRVTLIYWCPCTTFALHLTLALQDVKFPSNRLLATSCRGRSLLWHCCCRIVHHPPQEVCQGSAAEGAVYCRPRILTPAQIPISSRDPSA